MRKSLIAAIAAATLAGAAQAEMKTYKIDPGHTFVTFEIGHLGVSTNRGRWDKKEGTVQFDRAGRSGKVDITIDLASINTGTEGFDKHLRGADFFNTEQNKTARFVADQFSFDGDKVREVAGSLTMLGRTHPLTLKASNFNCVMHPMLKREVCGGDFEATLDRSAYGMDYGIARGFAKDVRLVIQVEAVAQ
jgi:polyisoprenoid-binding protein YceI